MKKFVFYPILFSINPILLLYAVNINDVSLSLLFPIIPILIIAVIASMWMLNKWLKDTHRVGFLLFIFAFWFFYYVPINLWVNNLHILPNFTGYNWIIYAIWYLAFIFLSSRWLWKKITSPETITMVLNYFCVILVSISIFRIARDLIPRYLMRTDDADIVQTLSPPDTPSNFPDIYYIILDGYARNDILQVLYYYDNSGFTKELSNRGFYIATQSQSNYVQTVLSLASSLNMEYLSGLPGTKPNRGQLLGMINQSKTRMLLGQVGYKSVAFSTGYEATDLINADYYFSPLNAGKSRDLEALVMINSVLDPFIKLGWINAPITKYRAGQDRVNNILTFLEKDVPLINDPKFVFAHIIAPHPPFIFDQYGPISPDETLILQGAETFQGSRDDYIQGYISDLQYINNRVLQTIDGILSNSKRRPIIILQADHGPDAYIDWNQQDNNCFKERFSILNAFYFPDDFPPRITMDITPVNTFAIILNAYFKTEIQIQTNHEYFATWENSYPFSDVSAMSQTCNIK
jgi:hypothetical protein